ncbi:hypothetical protein CW362_17720 [Streptomyces populi]|uniref:Uncharacterized protein n=1 Tax=Streptomyces populi TaxID=2058924 RepID=A0A2I0SP03_9ACTN|nr:hypothetical protein [Streptomyces populi]PKT71625.1 hypothetical protein CW362_17720 [Streptomyces populi]
MVGLFLRVLPFWVREPLLIVVGFPFSGLLFHAAARDRSAFGAFLGVVVLAVTAFRVHTVIKALRARRLARELESAAPAAAPQTP